MAYFSIPRSGLVGEWLLDGNLNDTNDGTKSNATGTNIVYSPSKAGYVKQSATFNSGGTSSVDTITLPALSGAYSLVGTFTPSAAAVSGTYRIMFRWSTGVANQEPLYLYYGGYLADGYRIDVQNTANTHFSSNFSKTFVAGKTYLVYVTVGSGSVNVYFDNALDNTLAYTGTAYTRTTGFAIGNRGYNRTEGWYGDIGSGRLYDHVLSEQERLQLWHEFNRKLAGGSDFGAVVPAPLMDLDFNGDGSDIANAVANSAPNVSFGQSDYFGIQRGAVFNGSNAYVQTAAVAIPSAFSIVSMFRRDDSADQAYYTGGGYPNGPHLFYASGSFIYRGSGGTNPLTYGSLSTGWHTCVISQNGTTATMYVDGVSVASGTVNSGAGTHAFEIGRLTASLYWLNGAFQRFQVLPTNVSADHAKFIHQQLVGRYPYAFRRSIPQNVVAKAKFYAPDGRYNIAQAGYDLSPVGSPTTVRAQQNKCVSTAAVGNYLANAADIPNCDIAAGNPYTLACWLKSSDTTGVAYYLFAGDATTPLNLSILLLSGVIQVDWSRANVADDLTSTGLAPDGKWHHVAATFSGGVTKVYLDGYLKATGSYTDTNGTGSNAITGISVARGFDSSTQVSDPFVTNSALSQEEIQRLRLSTYRQ